VSVTEITQKYLPEKDDLLYGQLEDNLITSAQMAVPLLPGNCWRFIKYPVQQ